MAWRPLGRARGLLARRQTLLRRLLWRLGARLRLWLWRGLAVRLRPRPWHGFGLFRLLSGQLRRLRWIRRIRRIGDSADTAAAPAGDARKALAAKPPEQIPPFFQAQSHFHSSIRPAGAPAPLARPLEETASEDPLSLSPRGQGTPERSSSFEEGPQPTPSPLREGWGEGASSFIQKGRRRSSRCAAREKRLREKHHFSHSIAPFAAALPVAKQACRR